MVLTWAHLNVSCMRHNCSLQQIFQSLIDALKSDSSGSTWHWHAQTLGLFSNAQFYWQIGNISNMPTSLHHLHTVIRNTVV